MDWITPLWPAPAHVAAVCTTRQGGVSEGPWRGFNLGDHVGDQPSRVALHREHLRRRLAARPVFMRQVHGHALVQLQGDTPDGVEADACMARHPQLACAVMVADCLPILFTDRRGTFVAAAHAGWRGLCGAAHMQGLGVVESTLQAVRRLGVPTGEVLAWLGPCIGPTAFEVGGDVRDAFARSQQGSERFFASRASAAEATGVDKWHADLAGLARDRLARAGVTEVYGNDSSPHWCTVGQPSRFFSHRRDGVSGRLAACIWLRG